MLVGILAVNLDLPLCVFLLDASDTNYNGFRDTIDQARQRWREIPSWMTARSTVPFTSGRSASGPSPTPHPRGRGACRLPGF